VDLPGDNKTKAEKERDILAWHQAALALLNVVIAGSKNLSLPHNRIAIASEAFPLLWNRNQSQARALVSQMVGDFAQAASSDQENSALLPPLRGWARLRRCSVQHPTKVKIPILSQKRERGRAPAIALDFKTQEESDTNFPWIEDGLLVPYRPMDSKNLPGVS
jgi:hypothetical protein